VLPTRCVGEDSQTRRRRARYRLDYNKFAFPRSQDGKPLVQATRWEHFWPNGEDDIPGIAESQAEVERPGSRLIDREGGTLGAALTPAGPRLHSGLARECQSNLQPHLTDSGPVSGVLGSDLSKFAARTPSPDAVDVAENSLTRIIREA
jgi:hypothetical protein